MVAEKKKLIIGNWKMNLDMQESSLYLRKLSQDITVHRDVEVVIAPSIFTLQSLSLQIDHRQFKLAAQDFYWRDRGAFTGEVSATQLRGIVQYGLVGHSERRAIFHETDKDIRNKVAAAVRNGISPVLCVGETAWERSGGETDDVLRDQLLGGLTNVTSEELDEIVIAYEPIWAIGTGKNAKPTDVKAAVNIIRDQIGDLYGKRVANDIRVLYGGSVNDSNAVDYLNVTGIDGLLMGTASLNEHMFSEIIKKAHKKGSNKGQK